MVEPTVATKIFLTMNVFVVVLHFVLLKLIQSEIDYNKKSNKDDVCMSSITFDYLSITISCTLKSDVGEEVDRIIRKVFCFSLIKLFFL